jgi:hypothetical protein
MQETTDPENANCDDQQESDESHELSLCQPEAVKQNVRGGPCCLPVHNRRAASAEPEGRKTLRPLQVTLASWPAQPTECENIS